MPSRVRAASKWKEADQLAPMSTFLGLGWGKARGRDAFAAGQGGFFCTLALLAWLFLSTMGQSSEIGSGLYGKAFWPVSMLWFSALNWGKQRIFYHFAPSRVLRSEGKLLKIRHQFTLFCLHLFLSSQETLLESFQMTQPNIKSIPSYRNLTSPSSLQWKVQVYTGICVFNLSFFPSKNVFQVTKHLPGCAS